MQNNKYWFFSSKLNTVLLLFLIILMIIALKIMFKDKSKYFPELAEEQTEQISNETNDNWKNYPLNATIGYHICEGERANDCISASQLQKVEGRRDDIVAFSIVPGQKVSGLMTVQGIVQGGYFFEANIVINILDANKKKTSYGPGHANATSDWMTAGPVTFSVDFDFSVMPKGKYYIELHNDNASGLPENDKSILIPIVIE